MAMPSNARAPQQPLCALLRWKKPLLSRVSSLAQTKTWQPRLSARSTAGRELGTWEKARLKKYLFVSCSWSLQSQKAVLAGGLRQFMLLAFLGKCPYLNSLLNLDNLAVQGLQLLNGVFIMCHPSKPHFLVSCLS